MSKSENTIELQTHRFKSGATEYSDAIAFYKEKQYRGTLTHAIERAAICVDALTKMRTYCRQYGVQEPIPDITGKLEKWEATLQSAKQMRKRLR